MESVCYGMIHGDKATCLEGFSPEMLAKIGDQFEKAAENAKADDKAEFRVLDRKSLSDDEMVLTLYMTSINANGESAGRSEQTVFDRINGEWKITDKHPPAD